MGTKTIGSQADTTENTQETSENCGQSVAGADVHVYGAKDCYEDCIKLFRYEEREKPECARACGLDAS